MGRYQINLTMDEQLREAVLFSAMRDGMTGSGKIRQILTQQLTRTMQSVDFLDYLASRQQRAMDSAGRADGGE